MKKIFTLIAAALMAVGVNAQTETDLDISQGWGWGWNSAVDYADGIMTINISGGYGAGSTGWNSGADWSKYNKLSIVIESYNNDWGKVYFTNTDTDHPAIAEKSFGTITSSTTVTVDFEPSAASSVYQLAIQGKAADDVIKVSRVYLTEALSYGEGKNIEFDQYGSILASAFDGLSDNAKVEFVVKAEGEATGTGDNAGKNIIGWGIGSLASLDGSVKVSDLPLKQIGENVYAFTIAELKAALNAPKDQYDRQGLAWNVWNQGNATCSRLKVTAYEVKEDPATSIQSVKAAKSAAIRYNLAGQQVDASYKGVVIENGKKVLVK